jgi:uncharacterized glyoxalase superfamily protein PhnB
MFSPRVPDLHHLAPVLLVDRVEPCVAFWVDRFGFEARNQTPWHDGTVFFASVVKGDLEIMYQTRQSVLADQPDAAAELAGRSASLFFTVPNLDDVERATIDAPVVKPRHRTPYGSTEIYVREPGGNVVGFAQF